ncbi:primosomal protein N' [Nocardioides zeae]|uniref:Probable replication restart protein PriA n=1 Tax=Nocardioides imazamoxiresistens TaxID=3231893 RepID=A0ABU3PZF1_9ACTN|nr:primosomal protein N' [Nocardioides zeae]MDT9594643.1 primosomal protein N' [Nocardioides zeae]
MTANGAAGEPEQPSLLPELRGAVRAARATGERRAARKRAEVAPAETDPVAAVLVDVPLAHLDRPFDYVVPATMAASAVPGARVKVRFAGQDVDGFVLARQAASDHPRLQPLRRVVSPEPVLRPDVAELSALVAARYAGARADVLRLAVPPRHATVEKEPVTTPAPVAPALDEVLGAAREAWAEHEHGAALCDHLARGSAARAVWSVAPGSDWAALAAQAAAVTYAAGRGVVLCVPDGRDVDRLDTALEAVLGEGHHVTLRADAGPAARYRDFLALSRGRVRIVVGTRGAVWAPVHDLGLVVVWDDGDDLFAEPRAPYPHAREVAVLRAEQAGAAALVGAHARSVESLGLLRSGWAQPVAPPRALLRERVRVAVAGATDVELARDPYARVARFPTAARDLVRRALETGPVLVQTPRSGYAAGLACERCRTPARCGACTGPLHQPVASAPPVCRWCGVPEPRWACPTCGHRGLRAPVVGEGRTADELGRAFPGVPVRTSAGDGVVARVPGTPAIVVATPGAEPVAEGGYAGVLLLDAWVALARVDLRTGEETLRRWMNAAALVRPGGEVVLVGDPATGVAQALVRWDPTGYAEREAAERAAAHLPPGSRLATVTGEPAAVEAYLGALELPPPLEVLGPVPAPVRPGRPPGEDEEVRAVVRVPAGAGAVLQSALGAAARERSARKLAAVRVQLDPPTL